MTLDWFDTTYASSTRIHRRHAGVTSQMRLRFAFSTIPDLIETRQLLTAVLLLIWLASSIGASNRLLATKSNGFNQTKTAAPSHRFRIRTITAGVNLQSTSDLKTIESAIEFLQRARKQYEDQGYEIQTLRIATQPLSQYLNGKSRIEALADLKQIDEVLSARNVILSIGPVITDDRHDAEFASWAIRLVNETKNINFSVTVASERGVHPL